MNRWLSVVFASFLFVALLLVTRTSHAQRAYVYYGPPPPPRYGYGPPRPYYEAPYAFQLGLDVEGVAPLNPPSVPGGGASAIGGGAGFKIRMGEQFRLPGVLVTPEAGYGYDHLWAADNLGNGYDWNMNRLFAGVRVGFGRIIVPTLYAHVGYGWRQTDAAYATGNNGGLAFDVGGALDFRVTRHVTLGAHLEYSQIALPTDTPQWLGIGGHLELLF
jgi:hypothetical protein